MDTATTAILDQHLGKTIPPTAQVAEKMSLLMAKGLPNYPNTAAQGSGRMWPGVFVPAYYAKYAEFFGVEPPDAAGYEKFLTEEEAWRKLSAGGPAASAAYPVVYEPDMGNYVSDLSAYLAGPTGKPQPVTVADAQHFELLPHLFGSLLAGDPSVRMTMGSEVQALVAWAYAWAKKDLPTEDNPRAIGWVLKRMAAVQAVYDALGSTADSRPMEVLKAVVKRLLKTQGTTLSGIPYLVINAEGEHQKDHGFCGISVWMTSEITHGLSLWLDILKQPWWAYLGLGLWTQVHALYIQGLACIKYPIEMAEKQIGAITGGMYDDYDVLGKLYVNGPWLGAMTPFVQPAILSARVHRPGWWEQFGKARCQAHYLGLSRYKPYDTNFVNTHTQSVAIMLAGEFGWRE